MRKADFFFFVAEGVFLSINGFVFIFRSTFFCFYFSFCLVLGGFLIGVSVRQGVDGFYSQGFEEKDREKTEEKLWRDEENNGV